MVCLTENLDKGLSASPDLLIVINPVPRFLQGKIVGLIFSRKSFIELILLRGKLFPLTSDVLTREVILGYPLAIFLSLK